jgi:hypothetical protein
MGQTVPDNGVGGIAMNPTMDKEWRESLSRMSPAEKRVFLRAVAWLRLYCPQCPIKHTRFDREPCRTCLATAGMVGRPRSTVN